MRTPRNIGIVAHIDAGKTTLTEQLLHLMGAVRRPGAVEDASTVTDWMVPEQERGITIGSAAVTCVWGEGEITLVDTPGHVDFTVEVERCLTVLDAVVVVLSGPDGVQAQTQTVWHQAAERGLPVVAFVNKLDRPGFDPEALQAEIRERLGIEPLPLQVPLVWGGDEIVLLDVFRGVTLHWQAASKRQGNRPPEVRPIADDETALHREIALEAIIDVVSSHDDAIAEALLDGIEPPPEAWSRALARAVAARACMPIVYGSARSGVGPQQLLDLATAVLPDATRGQGPVVFDRTTGVRIGRWAAHAAGGTAAFVFKTERRRGGRRVAWVRVFSGRLEPGARLHASGSPELLTLGGVVRLAGGDEIAVAALPAGAIGALQEAPGQRLPRTGETLGDDADGVTFESVRVPTPVIAVRVEADTLEADARMRQALDELATDDPSLAVLHDEDSGDTLLAGVGELQLELAIERIVREAGVPIRSGPPRPRRRHVPTRAATGTGRFDAGTVPAGIVEVRVRLEQAPGTTTARIAMPPEPLERPEWEQALRAGIERAAEVDADLVGAAVTVESVRSRGSALTPRAFWSAGRDAVAAAAGAARIREAEPWMRLAIAVPEDHVGRVTGDLARRRAKVLGATSRGVLQILDVKAPLGELIAYATGLRSLTAGRASFTMEPAGYQPIRSAFPPHSLCR